MAYKKLKPEQIKENMLVNFHSIIDGPVTKEKCVVTHEPWMMCGTWVCMIDQVSGAVSIDALSDSRDS